MTTLASSAAALLVRKNLDEVGPNNSVMYTDENSDNQSLDDIIYKNLPEAINAVHLAAPTWLLEGTSVLSSSLTGGTIEIIAGVGKVMTFYIPSSVKYLRLKQFKASDSDFIVTEVIPEASAEGRKQRNKHLCGRYDRPRLVQAFNELGAASAKFKYYAFNPDTTPSGSDTYISLIEWLIVVEEQFYTASVTDPSYSISTHLRQNIIDYLTAMVLETYGDQRAQYFFNKASNFPKV